MINKEWIGKTLYNIPVDDCIVGGPTTSDLRKGHYEFTRDQKLRKMSGE